MQVLTKFVNRERLKPSLNVPMSHHPSGERTVRKYSKNIVFHLDRDLGETPRPHCMESVHCRRVRRYPENFLAIGYEAIHSVELSADEFVQGIVPAHVLAQAQ